MTVRRRLFNALGANSAGQLVTVIIQLASLPIFLHFWSLEKYGQWLMLSAVPAYFALSDIGFLAVTVNKMTIVAASGDKERVNILFQTAIGFYIVAIFLAIFIACGLVYFFDVVPFDSATNKLVLIVLVLSAMIAMSNSLFDAVFRSSGEFSVGMHLVNLARLIEWMGLLFGLFFWGTFLSAAIGQLVGRTIASAIAWRIAENRHPDIKWSVNKFNWKELHEMLKPALSFMAFPLSNAISIQGMTLMVGGMFGANFLAVFNTYRTITRILLQGISIIGKSLWPEISRQYGANQINLVMMLYRKGMIASVILSIILCVFLYIFGEHLLHFWTSGNMPFDALMFNLFLLAVTITSFWQMGMILLVATNRHFSLSVSYFLGSIGSIILSYVLYDFLEKLSPVAGLIIFEVFLLGMCLVHLRSFKNANMQKQSN